ncbi:unnamed protein product [Rotaria socialis]|uniref:AN1-type domain-containing protein n=1 Tax=Rotaria socialis TaxID=392032 RepID=A0A820MWE1_9BILA|nr:unnamed protein product [Rotaria socialis]CAF3163433.1 unnamed protein product [Rotaria socialis]CAF3310673.1 unnamed protein product [Rotaria socialis]CAF3563544.1 unnamed protein product [Rotaria socialis]CAF4226527.1 unnamed protein product [Rotaria socialis]
MVELLGTYCEYPECNTLDFLPIHCIHCAKTFCKRHGAAPDHSCISLLQTTSINSTNSSSFLPCANSNGCKSQKSPISFTCSLCLKNFCVEHRHIDDHQCPHRSQSPPTHYSSQTNKTEIKPIDNFLKEKFVGTKNETLANKVAIMKLKQTAKGPAGLPMETRLHVFVQIDDGTANNKRYPFYLSKLWPLGKGLDYLTKELKLLPATRIILLEREQISLDLSTTINDLKELQEADVIILKKV